MSKTKNLSGSFENEEVTIIGNTPSRTRETKRETSPLPLIEEVPDEDWRPLKMNQPQEHFEPLKYLTLRNLFHAATHSVTCWGLLGLFLVMWLGSMTR